MGYVTRGIGVSIAKVESFIGSQDATSLIVMDDIDEGLHTMVDGQSYTIESALNDLCICNVSQTPSISHLYVYAIEQLCLHFGQQLDGVGHIQYLDDLEWQLHSTSMNSYFNLPSTNVFPDGQILALAQVKEMYSLVANQIEHESGDVENGREEYAWWLQQCIEANVDLITFCY